MEQNTQVRLRLGRARWRHDRDLIGEVAAMDVRYEGDEVTTPFAPDMIAELLTARCRAVLALDDRADEVAATKAMPGDPPKEEPARPVRALRRPVRREDRDRAMRVALYPRLDPLDDLVERFRDTYPNRRGLAKARQLVREHQERLTRLDAWFEWLDRHAANT